MLLDSVTVSAKGGAKMFAKADFLEKSGRSLLRGDSGSSNASNLVGDELLEFAICFLSEAPRRS